MISFRDLGIFHCRFEIEFVLAVVGIKFQFIAPDDLDACLLAILEDIGIVGIDHLGAGNLGDCHDLAVELDLGSWIGLALAFDAVFPDSLGAFNCSAGVEGRYEEWWLLQLRNVVIDCRSRMDKQFG